MPRPIRFNAFSMNAASHQSPGLWRHPRNTSVAFNRLGYWTDLARLLERGLFDALFIADVLGIYDVYQGGPEAALAVACRYRSTTRCCWYQPWPGLPSTWASASLFRSPTNTPIRSPGACPRSTT